MGVNIDPDQVDEIGRKTVAFAQSLRQDNKVDGAKVSSLTFGGVDSALDFVAVHGTAQQVVKKTLAGVVEDLDTFGKGLQAAVATLQDQEDVTQALFRALTLGISGPDPETGLDSDALTQISELGGMDKAETSREEALAEVRNGEQS